MSIFVSQYHSYISLIAIYASNGIVPAKKLQLVICKGLTRDLIPSVLKQKNPSRAVGIFCTVANEPGFLGHSSRKGSKSRGTVEKLMHCKLPIKIYICLKYSVLTSICQSFKFLKISAVPILLFFYPTYIHIKKS